MYFILKGRLNAYMQKPPEEIRKQRSQILKSMKSLARQSSEAQNSNQNSGHHSTIQNTVQTSVQYSIQNSVHNSLSDNAPIAMNEAGHTTEVHFPDKLETKTDESKNLNSILELLEYDEHAKSLDLFSFADMSKFIVDGVFTLKYIGTMEPSQAFGEVSLLRNKPRSATVIAIEDCHLAVLDKKAFEDILVKAEREKIEKNLEFFNQVFGVSISREIVSRLAYSFEKRSVPLEGTIFKEGDGVETIMIIKKGEVMVRESISKLTFSCIKMWKSREKRSKRQEISRKLCTISRPSRCSPAIGRPKTILSTIL